MDQVEHTEADFIESTSEQFCFTRWKLSHFWYLINIIFSYYVIKPEITTGNLQLT